MKARAEIAFTPAAQVLQMAHGSRDAYHRIQAESQPGEGPGERQSAFLAFVVAQFGTAVAAPRCAMPGPADLRSALDEFRVEFKGIEAE